MQQSDMIRLGFNKLIANTSCTSRGFRIEYICINMIKELLLRHRAHCRAARPLHILFCQSRNALALRRGEAMPCSIRLKRIPYGRKDFLEAQ